MKKIIISCLAIVAIAFTTKAQDTYTGAQAGQTLNFTTSSSVASTFQWTETTDADNIATFNGATNTANISVDIATGVTPGQSAVISVVASSTSTPSCPSPARTLTIVVGNRAFTASRTATNPAYCQNATASDLSFSLAKDAAFSGYTITRIYYYFDANSNNVKDASETLSDVAPASQLAFNIPVSTATLGTQTIRIYSITGTSGALSASAIQATGASAVGDVVTVNEIPALNQITIF